MLRGYEMKSVHDVKAPLASIDGFSALLLRGDYGKLNGKQKKIVETIKEEAKKAIQVMDKFVDK